MKEVQGVDGVYGIGIGYYRIRFTIQPASQPVCQAQLAQAVCSKFVSAGPCESRVLWVFEMDIVQTKLQSVSALFRFEARIRVCSVSV